MVIVLSLLLVVVLALYFLTIKVFFNTFKNIFNSQNKTDDELTAYDGCYYPCTLYLDVQPRGEEDTAEITQVFNFLFYESNNIVFCLTISDELAKHTSGLSIVPNVMVFQVAEGVWTWKY